MKGIINGLVYHSLLSGGGGREQFTDQIKSQVDQLKKMSMYESRRPKNVENRSLQE